MRLLVAVGVTLELIAPGVGLFGAALVALRLALPLPAAALGVIPADLVAITMAAAIAATVSPSQCHLCRFQQAEPMLGQATAGDSVPGSLPAHRPGRAARRSRRPCAPGPVNGRSIVQLSPFIVLASFGQPASQSITMQAARLWPDVRLLTLRQLANFPKWDRRRRGFGRRRVRPGPSRSPFPPDRVMRRCRDGV